MVNKNIRLEYQLRNELWHQLGDQLGNELWYQLRDQLRDHYE